MQHVCACKRIRHLPPIVKPASHAAAQTARQLRKCRTHFFPVRHGKLCRRAWRWRSQVRDKIANRKNLSRALGSGDDGYLRRRHCPCERRRWDAKSSRGTATPRPMMMTSAAFWAFINFTAAVSCAAASALHKHRAKHNLRRRPAPREYVANILHRRARRRHVLPMRAGNGGIGRLYSSANSPSAANFFQLLKRLSSARPRRPLHFLHIVGTARRAVRHRRAR